MHATLVKTMDIKALSIKIIQGGGIKAMQDKPDERLWKDRPKEVINKLIKLIRYKNIFNFHDTYVCKTLKLEDKIFQISILKKN